MLMLDTGLTKLLEGDDNFEEFFRMPVTLTGGLTMEQVVNEYFHSAYFMRVDSMVVGRFAVYENESLTYQGEPALCVGSYACIDDELIAEQLFERMELICKEMGHNRLIGPMNGSTWHTHRFGLVNGEKEFSLDIVNPDYYNAQFASCGYESISEYSSRISNERLELPSWVNDDYWGNKGLVIRSLNLNKLKEELAQLARFSNHAFQNNFLFTPIDVKTFVDKYLQIIQNIDISYIHIVEDRHHEIQGFSFSFPDPTPSQFRTMIIKTIAIRPDSKYGGLGTYLARKTHSDAMSQGYDVVVHAFMRDDNVSRNTSDKYSGECKTYRLYGKHFDNH